MSLVFGAIGAYGQVKIWTLTAFKAQKNRIAKIREERAALYDKLSENTNFLMAYSAKEIGACISLGVFMILISSAASSIEAHGVWSSILSSGSAGLGALFGSRVGNLSRVMNGVLGRL